MTLTLTRTSFKDTKKNVTRQTLERNVMDYLTFDRCFDEAQDIVDEATREELMTLLVMIQEEEREEIINAYADMIYARI